MSNIQEIVIALIPKVPDDKQLFWIETEQGVLAVALLYYFELGLTVANFHLGVDVISRGKGRTIVKAASYITGKNL